ncbi:hypothetical protein D3C73_861720 [compost metagenome]
MNMSTSRSVIPLGNVIKTVFQSSAADRRNSITPAVSVALLFPDSETTFTKWERSKIRSFGLLLLLLLLLLLPLPLPLLLLLLLLVHQADLH